MNCITKAIELETIINRINRKDINLQPDFQRGEIWTKLKKQKLIDSILRGWKIPPIHIVENNNSDEVLDGQQRLVSIRDFCNNEFAIDGDIEPYDDNIKKLDGYKFENMPSDVKKNFLKYDITFIYLNNYKPNEPAELFDRLNQPMKLTSSEQRNAYMGKARDQIKNLVILFEKEGASIDTIGFSNKRLKYEDLMSKFCYVLTIKTLKEKIISDNIIEIYRKESGFNDDIIITCENIIKRFMKSIREIKNNEQQNNLYLTQAIVYSWFLFIYRNIKIDDKELMKYINEFHFCYKLFKNLIDKNNTKEEKKLQKLLEQFDNSKDIERGIKILEPFFNIYILNAQVGNTNVKAIIYRDLIMNLLYILLFNKNTNNLCKYFTEINDRNIYDVLDQIIEKEKWEQLTYEK